MPYHLRALKNGECDVRDYVTFSDGGRTPRRYYLYIWLLTGGPHPVVVDTGLSDTRSFNRGVETYIPGGVRQRSEERTVPLLRRAGVEPGEVSHVFVSHLHPDHYDGFPLFSSAVMVASKAGFTWDRLVPSVRRALKDRGPDSLRLVEDEEVLPGIRTLPLGVHSPCSMGIIVETDRGRVALAGDIVYLYENLEPSERPPGGVGAEAWRAAVRQLRERAEVIIPGHDPRVLAEWGK